ncbi:MAG: dihydrodipicolinate synthase family protein [Rhodothermales bacterium]|nr:dihydrodipicolinate synthase family protein [Rhodothermales bacterium]
MAGPAATHPAHGVWSPALVPVEKNLGIDVARFIRHARWLLDSGCHGLVLFGTTSEANSFSVEERTDLLDAVINDGVDPNRLMVGTGCCAFTESVRLTGHALSRGCSKVLMLPPFYYKGMSDEGLARSFATVIDRVADPNLRIYLYHFPQLSGVPISTGLIDILLANYADIIAGLKDSSGDWSNTAGLLERYPELAIFPGSERFLLDGVNAGSAGCITATANVNAGAIRAVYDAWAGGDDDLANLNDVVCATRSIIQDYPMVPALKYLTARRLSDEAWRQVRPPMVELTAERGAELVRRLDEQGLAV